MYTIKKKTHLLRKRIIRNLLGLFSLSGMLFIFQACYGTPQDFGDDFLMEGTVLSEENQAPVKGIEVRLANLPQYTATDAYGKFSIYCPKQDEYTITFSDVDGDANGLFVFTDSTFSVGPSQTEMSLSVSLKRL